MPYDINDECVACGTCAEECPADAIEEAEDTYVINQDECTDCGTCMEVCPVGAVIEV